MQADSLIAGNASTEMVRKTRGLGSAAVEVVGAMHPRTRSGAGFSAWCSSRLCGQEAPPAPLPTPDSQQVSIMIPSFITALLHSRLSKVIGSRGEQFNLKWQTCKASIPVCVSTTWHADRCTPSAVNLRQRGAPVDIRNQWSIPLRLPHRSHGGLDRLFFLHEIKRGPRRIRPSDSAPPTCKGH